jgi:hypothetical protein
MLVLLLLLKNEIIVMLSFNKDVVRKDVPQPLLRFLQGLLYMLVTCAKQALKDLGDCRFNSDQAHSMTLPSSVRAPPRRMVSQLTL